MSQDDIKIRIVPRSNERPEKPRSKEQSLEIESSNSHGLILVGAVAAALIMFSLFGTSEQSHQIQPSENRSVSSLDSDSDMQTRIGASVERHMKESLLREEMMKRKFEIENAHSPTQVTGPDVSVGVERIEPLMAREKTDERLFSDLDLNSMSYSDRSLDDRINSRLANRKWLNEVERAERINFVRNFIRSAYERGYEVTLNENLVVVGVKKIKKDRAVTIDQIMDRMAKQGL